MKPTIALIAALLPAIVACNGSGSSTAPSVSFPILTAPVAERPDPCERDPIAAWSGTYRGDITLDETERGGPYCVWSVAMTLRVRGDAIGCALEGEALSDVEQLVAPAPEEPAAAECRAGLDTLGGGAFALDDTLLDFAFVGRDVPTRGPFSGDGSTLIRYAHLFAGRAPLVEAFRADPLGALVPVDLDPIDGRTIDGWLRRES